MTDGTEHPEGAAAPGQDPWNPSSAPQPSAAPSGYGYPQQEIPSGQQPGYQQPGYQQAGHEPPPAYQQPSFSGGMDWEAMAERNEAQRRRRKRLWTGGIALVACLLGVGAGFLVVRHENGKPNPPASASSSPSTAPSSSSGKKSPTVPGQDNVLADKSGENNLALGPDAAVDDVGNGYAARFRSNVNSYAQSSTQLIDVSKSFSISAWVYNEAPNSPRSAISQGDGDSSSFNLGRDASGDDRNWVFEVQTAAGGADSTTYEAKAAKSIGTVGEWVLLTGTYDAKAKTITLYVNDKKADSTKIRGIWAGKGPLQLGRARTHGVWGDYWAGVVGHIQVWETPLTPDQVADVHKGGSGGDAKPVASWLM
ncbi:LamG-like jellyroll fold domain-containing protein [Streptomyces sp. NPDC046862]|uniref:LamG domain-containing protein n=1 Tax=Streptomyces sp. NPDC046862 TaxID=3154603 RepID=UPI003453ED83